MKSTVLSKMLFAATALLLVVVSCSGQDKPPEKLLGTWSKKVETNTITLTFKPGFKSEVEFTGDNVIDVFSDYEISGTRITFNDQGGEFAADVPGTYEFKVDDTSLNFTLVDDPVEGRNMLVQGTWSRAAGAAE